MPSLDPQTIALLRLTLVSGLGPILIGRLIQHCGSPAAALQAPASTLQSISGIGKERAARIRAQIDLSESRANAELAEADRLGVNILSILDPAYPPLLRQIPDAPPILYLRGSIDPAAADQYPVGIVGSRTCTHYGREQASRFAMHLAQSGLCIVSGGARGIDTAAHHAALAVRGRTIVVMGCGLSSIYPPENADLFDLIAASHGAIVSELPLKTAPTPDNFPARNRIISGISLGVIVVEAGRRSGALITARQAVEEHGRDVFALPGRVDSAASEGTLDLLKAGGAALVTHPRDVLDALESSARHHFFDTHHAITRDPARDPQAQFDWRSLAPTPDASPSSATVSHPTRPALDVGLSDRQRSILDALHEPRTIDELSTALGGDPASLRADITMLEIKRRVSRAGSRIARTSVAG
ncbi:MAG: DNA-processing protein DprA [Phycisphaerales bacterium]